jgi:hypothetical protein
MVFRSLRSSTAVLAAITIVIDAGPLTMAAAPAAHAATAPARVAAAPAPAPHHRGVRQTADLYDRGGKLVRHVDGEDFGAAAVPIINQLRADRATLEQWRANARRMGERSKRGMASVAMMLQIIDALSAPTAAEYHARLQKLPIKVTHTPSGTSVEGTLTTFAIKNVVRLRLFTAPVVAVGDDTSAPAEGPGGPREPDAAATVAAQEECYDDYGQPTACATEQDRQDAIVTAIAIDDEASALESEMNQQWAEYEAYCNDNPWACEGSEGEAVGGPSAMDSGARCGSEFWNFVGAAASTHAAAFALVGAALAPAAIPGLVLVGLGLAVVGGFAWMISGGMSLNDCARRMMH